MPSAEYQRAWRACNPEKQAGYSRKYKAANKETINAAARQRYVDENGREKAAAWAKANPDKIREAKRKYRTKASTQAKERAYQQRWFATNPERKLLQQARRRARLDGLSFNLTLRDVSIPLFCPVLGIPLERGIGQHHAGSPSLDKIIPARGYVRGNVRVISFRANTLKSDAQLDELRALVRYVETSCPR